MKRPYLVLYDYDTGGVWSYLRADSPAQIHAKFRDLVVYEEPPAWMDEDERRAIEARAPYDVETAELDDPVFLARLLRHRSE